MGRTLKQLIDRGDVDFNATYMDQAEKEALALSGEPFIVNAVNYIDKGRFGPMWTMDITLAGEDTSISQSAGPRRNSYYRDLQKLAEREPIHGVALQVVDKRAGNLVLAPCAVEDWKPWDGDVEAVKSPTQKQPA